MSGDIFTLIGTYGFPIVVAVYLLWERRKTAQERNAEVAEAFKSTAIIIQNNTSVLGSISELMRDCKRNIEKGLA